MKELLARLENSRFAPLVQFVKFGMVGAFNTVLTYVIEMLGYYVLFRHAAFEGVVRLLGTLGVTATGDQVRAVAVTLLSFVITSASAFLLNSRFVFRAQEKPTARQTLKAYGKTVMCYALTGIVISPAMKVWLGGLGMPFWAASLTTLVVTIPLNFLMNKFWAFAGRR